MTDVTVIDIDPGNPDATLVVDLCQPDSLPAGCFDCVILTQTAQLLRDLDVAITNIYRSLAPGGVTLISVPTVSRVDRDSPADYWRFTPQGLEHKLATLLPEAEIDVWAHGNVLLGIGFLLGLAADELSPAEQAVNDPYFPLVACARVRRTS